MELALEVLALACWFRKDIVGLWNKDSCGHRGWQHQDSITLEAKTSCSVLLITGEWSTAGRASIMDSFLAF
jgi:hypothetical protein